MKCLQDLGFGPGPHDFLAAAVENQNAIISYHTGSKIFEVRIGDERRPYVRFFP